MNKLWMFFTILLDVYPFWFLQYLPFRDKLKIGYKKTMLYSAVVLMFQFLGFVWLTLQPFCNLDLMLIYRCCLLITLCLLTVFFVRDNFFKVYFVFGLMTPYVVLTIVTGSFLAHLLPLENAPLYMASVLCRMVVIALIFPPLYLLAKQHLVPAMAVQDNSIWQYAFPVPVMFSLVSLLYVDKDYETQVVPITELLGMFAVFLGCIFTCFFLLKALQQAKEKAELAQSERMSHQMLCVQQDQYKLIVGNIESARTARHDLRHFLSAATRFIENKQYDKLAEFISSFMEPLAQETELTICENYAVNSIAGYYIRLAKTTGIDVSFAFAIHEGIPVSDIDLCVIVGNAIENAIEACRCMVEGKQFIHVYAKVIEDNISFTCDNSFDGAVQMSGEDYLSRKRDGREKGIGLSSIATVVKKHNGQMRVEHTEDTFMVSVLLPL